MAAEESFADVLDVLDALDQLRDQLSSIQSRPPDFEMSSDEDEEVPVVVLANRSSVPVKVSFQFAHFVAISCGPLVSYQGVGQTQAHR